MANLEDIFFESGTGVTDANGAALVIFECRFSTAPTVQVTTVSTGPNTGDVNVNVRKMTRSLGVWRAIINTSAPNTTFHYHAVGTTAPAPPAPTNLTPPTIEFSATPAPADVVLEVTDIGTWDDAGDLSGGVLSPNVSFQWLLNGTPIVGATQYTYTARYDDFGIDIYGTFVCLVSVIGPGGVSSPASSNSLSRDPWPPELNCPTGYMYTALDSSQVTLVGGKVDTWNEWSGSLDFVQPTDADRPADYVSGTVVFNGGFLLHESGTGPFDFLHQTGGTVAYLYEHTGSFANSGGTDSTVLRNYGNIFTWGVSTRIIYDNFPLGTGSIRFGAIVGQPFLATEALTTFQAHGSGGSRWLSINRWVSGTVAGVGVSNAVQARINGVYIKTNGWTGWAGAGGAGSSGPTTLGPIPNGGSFYKGGLRFIVICPDVLTDAECVAVESWVTATIGPLGALP